MPGDEITSLVQEVVQMSQVQEEPPGDGPDTPVTMVLVDPQEDSTLDMDRQVFTFNDFPVLYQHELAEIDSPSSDSQWKIREDGCIYRHKHPVDGSIHSPPAHEPVSKRFRQETVQRHQPVE